MEAAHHVARRTPEEGRAASRDGEDADLNDLPVHFQSMEDGGRGRSAPGMLPVSQSHSPLVQQTMTNYRDQQTSVDTMAPQRSSSTSSTSSHQPPSQGKVDSGCQYSPSDIDHLFPSSALTDHSISNIDQRFVYPSPYPAPHGVMDRHYYPPHSGGSGAVYGAAPHMHNGLGTDSLYRPPALHHPAVSNGTYRLSHAPGLSNTAGHNSYTATSLAGSLLPDHGSRPGQNPQGGGGVSTSSGGDKKGSGQVGGEKNSSSSGSPAAKPYKCPECDASFTRVDHLSRHLRTQRSHFHSAMAENGSSQSQSPAQYHACPHCSKLFTRRDHMKRHSKIHLRGEPVKCVECLMWFPSKGELNRHLLDAHNIQVFECAQCGKGFLQADYLTRHLRDKHHLAEGGTQGSKGGSSTQQGLHASYRCGICSLYFATESESTTHMMVHSRRDSNSTPTLPLSPNQRVDARGAAALSHSVAPVWPGVHHQQHSRGLPVPGGPLTGQPFSHSPLQLQKPAQYFSNGIKPQTFPHSQSDSIKREPCEGDSGDQGRETGELVRVGDDKSHLSAFTALRSDHTAQPSGKRPFVCGVCGMAFARPPSLKIHLRKHCGHRPFPCVDCGASFASSSNLIRHQRTHSGERPFKCDQCSAAFTHKGALINHERVHTGQRPYECELCGASFARCDALSRHRKTHKENRMKMEQEALAAGLFALYN